VERLAVVMACGQAARAATMATSKMSMAAVVAVWWRSDGFAPIQNAESLLAGGGLEENRAGMATRSVKNKAPRISVTTEALLRVTGARPHAQWSVDTSVTEEAPRLPILAQQPVETLSRQATRAATMVTTLTTTAAAAHAVLKPGTLVRSPAAAAAQRAAKYVVTANALATKPVMTAT